MSTFSFLRDKPQWRIMLERDKIGIGYEYPETVRDHAAEATRKIDSIMIRARSNTNTCGQRNLDLEIEQA
jgi:hypothetical protein